MIDGKFIKKMAATVAVSGMMLAAIASPTLAAAILRSDGSVTGAIRANSSSFRFRNEARTGSPIQTAPGDEYIFTARQGNIIDISVDPATNSSLSPVLVLLSPTGRQVAYDDAANSLRYRVPEAGEYRLLVLGQNNTRGTYTLSISGIGEGVAQTPGTQTNDQRRQILQTEFGLNVLENCPPATGSLAVISFVESGQVYRYCANPNRFVRAGEYTYDYASRNLNPGAPVAQTPGTQTNDQRRQLLEREFGLRVLDNCPPATGSLAVISFVESGQVYRYCANPNRFVRAGEYTYDPIARELRPGTAISQVPGTQADDQRRQFLQNEFGLRVLDNCPPATGNLVVISFVESTQTYRYCANPNRVVRAGEYTYDPVAGNLRPGTPTAQTPSTQITDRRRQLLEDDFGLRVLDNCPAATGSLVVVSFPESGQVYRYCANPNRSYPAGEYTFNARTNNLEAATAGTTERCTVSVGGVCIVR